MQITPDLIGLLAHAGSQLTPPDDLNAFGAMAEFGRYGAKHILLGFDHLMFLLGLAILARGIRDVVEIAALFFLSYGTTLVGFTLLGIDLGGSVAEATIAVSVGVVGAQIAFGREGHWLSRDPRPVALLFGLAHGIGLSALLQELRLPGDDLLPSVIGFTLGVELGQLAVLAIFIGLLSLLRDFPLPARERIPAGFSLISASCFLFAFATFAAAPGHAHPTAPPQAPSTPPAEVDPIPAEDEDLYHSRVTGIKPAVEGLSAAILGGDEKLQVTWTGQPPLTVLGTQGEPMLRFSSRGIELNERSASAYLSGDRYAQVPLPADVDANAAPKWRLVETPGPFAWYEHRAHWLDDDRPELVGDGTEPTPIFHWTVPMRLGDQPVAVAGDLDWVPDPAAIRAERSGGGNELLYAATLLGAMALGAGVGLIYRRRLEAAAAPLPGRG